MLQKRLPDLLPDYSIFPNNLVLLWRNITMQLIVIPFHTLLASLLQTSLTISLFVIFLLTAYVPRVRVCFFSPNGIPFYHFQLLLNVASYGESNVTLNTLVGLFLASRQAL